MCDYSLHNVASRPAKVGDRLVSARFTNTSTRAFVAQGKPDTVVCLLPGTEVSFEDDVEYRNPIARLFSGFENEVGHRPSLGRLFSGLRRAHGKVARFREINLHSPHTHHDALEFVDGTIVLLTQLCSGQRETVISSFRPGSSPPKRRRSKSARCSFPERCQVAKR